MKSPGADDWRIAGGSFDIYILFEPRFFGNYGMKRFGASVLVQRGLANVIEIGQSSANICITFESLQNAKIYFMNLNY